MRSLPRAILLALTLVFAGGVDAERATAPATAPKEHATTTEPQPEPLNLIASLMAFDDTAEMGRPIHLIVAVRNPYDHDVSLPALDLAPFTSVDIGDDEVKAVQLIEHGMQPNARLMEVGQARRLMQHLEEAQALPMRLPYVLAPNQTHLYLINLQSGPLQQVQDRMKQQEKLHDGNHVTHEKADVHLSSADMEGRYRVRLVFDSRGVPEPGVDADAGENEELRVIKDEVKHDGPPVRFETNVLEITLTRPPVPEGVDPDVRLR